MLNDITIADKINELKRQSLQALNDGDNLKFNEIVKATKLPEKLGLPETTTYPITLNYIITPAGKYLFKNGALMDAEEYKLLGYFKTNILINEISAYEDEPDQHKLLFA